MVMPRISLGAFVGEARKLISVLFGLEVERAWAWARRPGPDFRLALHKAQAQKSLGLTVAKLGEPFFKARAQARRKITCQTDLTRLETGSKVISVKLRLIRAPVLKLGLRLCKNGLVPSLIRPHFK